MTSLYSEIRNGKLTIPHPGNRNVLATIPFSLDRNNRGGIAPIEMPHGLKIMETTAGVIDGATNLHRDQLPFPINEIIFEDVEPRQRVVDELLFVKPSLPNPPRPYELKTNHELDLELQVYSDGTPKHHAPPDPSHIRQGLYSGHLSKLKDIEMIPDVELKTKLKEQEMTNLLVSDPQLYSAIYNRPVSVVNTKGEADFEKTEEKKEEKEEEMDFKTMTSDDIVSMIEDEGVKDDILNLNIEANERINRHTAIVIALIKNVPEEVRETMTTEEMKENLEEINNISFQGVKNYGGVEKKVKTAIRELLYPPTPPPTPSPVIQPPPVLREVQSELETINIID